MAPIMLLLVLGALLAARSADGLKVVVGPGQTECVSETVTDEHFLVHGGPRIDGRVLVSGYSQYYVPFIGIKIMDPHGEQIWTQQHVYSEAHFNVGARGPGVYKACFHNPWESRTDAVVDLVYFTLAHLRSGSAGIRIPKGTEDNRGKEVAHQDHIEEVRRTILGMSEFMQVIAGSQRYLQRKLERHQTTMLSSKSRTMWYTLLEAAGVIAVAGAQIYTITRFFKPGRIRLAV
eukprot:CAMPEP_0202884770 /NCGR_PEP_ID=MMETSP1391-20130828/41321_1 /ASSEMBLY_ACC=CAM_ASM_000867 /TAXON_ID=1034604 /ORGANISM="Chlamydomonas leiostraca, Strain SAG 11-49" /LENGTH=232 /DNA_ID=CAMNT_0049568001 /DNA_START=16 /DNA_END=714 /DNA_ORIENTATION=+